MIFFLLINVKMPTIVGILIFMSGKNSILGLSDPKKPNFWIFLSVCAFKISCSTELSMKENFIASGPGVTLYGGKHVMLRIQLLSIRAN